jgi:O-methyltransferase/methyltransferase family protein
MSTDIPPQGALARMMSGYAVSQLIRAAAELEIPDLLEAGPATSDELARAAGVRPELLARVMRALAMLGVVAVDDAGRFEPTELSRLLTTGTPGSMRALAVSVEESYQAWGRLLHTIETGETAFDACFGLSRFEYLAQHPEAAAAFNDAMAGMLKQNAARVVDAIDFSRFRRIVDVGGGRGVLLATVLEANPAATGVLVETPAVIAEAREHVEANGLGERCELVAADFFESLPEGGDAYLLSQTIHNWADPHAVRILRNCREAMAAGGATFVIEMVMPERLEGSPMDYPLVMTDLQMMVMTGGRERTEAEHRRLFEAAGLTLRAVVPTRSPLVVLEALAEPEQRNAGEDTEAAPDLPLGVPTSSTEES